MDLTLTTHSQPEVSKAMETVSDLSLDEFRKIMRRCSGKAIALDTETTGLKWWNEHLTTIGFHCPAEGIEGTIDIGRPVNGYLTNLRDPKSWVLDDPELLVFEENVRAIVREELKPGTITVFHNAKFDMHMLGVDPYDCYGWRYIDTTVLIHLRDSRDKKGMEQAEKALLGTNSKRNHIEQAPSDKKIRKKVWLWPAHIRQDYCVNDCRVTWQFLEVLAPIIKDLELWDLFLKEMKYLKIIYKSERIGFQTDPEFIGRAYMQLVKHRKDLEQQLYDAVGYEFAWRSAKKLSYALYDNLGIPMPVNPFATMGGTAKSYKTKMGFERVMEIKSNYTSTNTSTFLLMEKAHHPLGELVAALREADKLAKQLGKWQTLVDAKDVIHTNYKMTGTRTGRLSSSDPNLANIPSDTRGRFTQGIFSGGTVRTDEYNLRKGFIARPGKILSSVDYKQMEMRMFGIDSEDPHMLEALTSGVDIHLYIAHKVWGKCGPELDKIHREWSKTIGFGLIYGMTTGSLEHKLGMTKTQAKQVVEDYWGAFPRIRPWIYDTIMTLKKDNYERYWSGRIWREETEMFMYKGANARIQGGCADLLSVAAIRLDDWIVKTFPKGDAHILSYIYDEMIVECPIADLAMVVDNQMRIMQVPDLFGIPFLTDAKVGYSYGDLHEYDPKKDYALEAPQHALLPESV
jgi:DNA polymerase I